MKKKTIKKISISICLGIILKATTIHFFKFTFKRLAMAIRGRSLTRSGNTQPYFIFSSPVKKISALVLIFAGAVAIYKATQKQKNESLNKKDFASIAKIAEICAQNELSPRILEIDNASQKIQFEMRLPLNWNDCQISPQMYQEAMKSLKKFHDLFKPDIAISNYAPYHFLFQILDHPKYPVKVLVNLKKIFNALEPWLKKNATLCHGNFCKENVVLYKKRHGFKAQMVEFNSCMLGDPFYDISRFCKDLDYKQRAELFSTYLNRDPTKAEIAHLELMNLILFAVSAVIHFNESRSTTGKQLMNTFTERCSQPTFNNWIEDVKKE